LTEMVKNKEKIADDKAKELEVVEQKKKEDNAKKTLLAKAKARMTAALNKEALERKAKELEEARKKRLIKKPLVKENALLAITAKKDFKKKVAVPPKKLIKKPPIKKVVKPAPIIKKKPATTLSKSSLAAKLAAKLAKKADPKPAPKPMIASSPAPFLDGAPPSSAQLVSVSTNETSEQELQEEKPQEKGANKTKLYDGSVNQVIEEVQTEQEAKAAEQKYKSSLAQTQQEVKE